MREIVTYMYGGKNSANRKLLLFISFDFTMCPKEICYPEDLLHRIHSMAHTW